MKCQNCYGTILFEEGNSTQPPRLYCMACGREPKGKKTMEEMEKKELRKCLQCKNDFEPLRKRSRFCSKKCRDKSYQKDKIKDDNGKKRRYIRHAPVDHVVHPSITEGITLDAQLLRAVKKSAILVFVKNDLPKIVEDMFA